MIFGALSFFCEQVNLRFDDEFYVHDDHYVVVVYDGLVVLLLVTNN
jgi:hypothetical protein